MSPAFRDSPANRFDRHIATGSSTPRRRQFFSQGAGHTHPRTAGNAISRRTVTNASLASPTASCRSISGIFILAGHPRRQGPSQSPTCSPSSNSTAVRRASNTSSVSLCTTMPSRAGYAHAGTSRRKPSTRTTHNMQEVPGRHPSR